MTVHLIAAVVGLLLCGLGGAGVGAALVELRSGRRSEAAGTFATAALFITIGTVAWGWGTGTAPWL